MALMAAASLYALARILSGAAQFSKTVSGGKARLLLRTDRDMENVEISDPVCFDHTGKSMGFSIPALKKGAEWSFEYSISSPKMALPASLTADAGGRRVSMLSELYIEDGKGAQKIRREKNTLQEAAPAMRTGIGKGRQTGKRKLPKASR